MTSAIRDQRGILRIFLTVNEEITSSPMIPSRSFRKLFGVLRENGFWRNIALPRKKD
jgi:hypothetical protein